MLGCLLAYDRNGDVIATLDSLVFYGDDGQATHLVDFVAMEAGGAKLRDVADFCVPDAPFPPRLIAEQAAARGIAVAQMRAQDIVLPKDDPWRVAHDRVVGSGSWPEWLGAGAHAFRVELSAGRIAALVHKASGHRRQRSAIETAIADRVRLAEGAPADIRDLVGGPDRPLMLDEEGRTIGRSKVN